MTGRLLQIMCKAEGPIIKSPSKELSAVGRNAGGGYGKYLAQTIQQC